MKAYRYLEAPTRRVHDRLDSDSIIECTVTVMPY